MSQDLIGGRYLVRRVIHSTCSEILHVTDQETGRDLALKSIPTRDASLTAQLRNEFLILSSLRHQSIIQAFDFGIRSDVGPYMAMQYGADSTLEAYRARLSPKHARDVLLQLASAVDFLSSRGILHRDISPSNILINEAKSPEDRPNALLIDFGMATGPGAISAEPAGTLPFIAPEVLANGTQDLASEVHSLGASVASTLDPSCMTPDFQSLLDNLTSKDRTTRLQAWEVLLTEVWPAPIHSRDSLRDLLYRPQVQGCNDKLDRIKEALEPKETPSINRGAPRVFLITGEEGIGKSRLSAEIELLSKSTGRNTLLIRCSKESITPLEPLFSLTRHHRGPMRASLGNASYPASGPVRHTVASREVGNNSAQIQAIQALANDLHVVSRAEPLTILLEDIQNADPETLELVRLLAVQAAGPVVILTCLGERRLRPELEALVAFITARVSVVPIELSRLSLNEVDRFLKATIGESGDARELTNHVHALTDGNPLLMQEVLLDIADAGALVRRPGGYSLLSAKLNAMDLPKTLESFAESKLSRLEPHLRRLLEILSVVDGSASGERIAGISGRNTRAVLQDLQSLVAQGLLVGAQTEHGCIYSFRHRCIRDLSYNAIDPSRRRSLHQSFAQILEELNPLTEELTNRIAHHYIEAADHDKAPEYAFRAASHAMERFATKRAINLYTKGLDLIPGDCLEQRFHALETLGGLLVMIGNMTRATSVYNEMQLLARTSGSRHKEAIATGQMARLLIEGGEVRRAAEYAEHAITRFVEASDIRGEISGLVTRARAIHWLGDSVSASKVAESAHARSLQTADLHSESVVRQLQGVIACDMGDHSNAITFHEEAFRLKTEINDVVGAAVALCNIGLVHLEQNHLSTARECFERALVEAREKGMSLAAILASVNLGEVHRLTGQLEAAEYLYRESVALAEGSNRKYLLAYATYSLFFPGFLRGQLSGAREHLSKAEQLQKSVANRSGLVLVLAAKSSLYRHLGLEQVAELAAEEALQVAREVDSPPTTNAALAACFESRADVPAGNDAVVPSRAEVDKARKHGKTPSFIQLLYAAARFQLQHGDLNEALALLAEAKEIAKEAGLMPDLARGALIEGQALLRLQRRAEARVVLEEGAAEARRMGLRPLLSHLLYWLAQAQEAVGDAAGAGASLFEAADLVTAIASEIGEDDLQQSYLRVPTNAAIRDRAERLERAGFARRATSGEAKSAEEIAAQVVEDVGRELGADAPLRDVLTAVLDRAIESIRADRGLVFHFDSDSHEVTIARDLEGETIQDATDYCRSILKDVASGQPILSVDVPSDERFSQRRSVVLYKILALMCVPLKVGDRVLGALYFDSRSGHRPFRDADMRLVKAFSDRFALAIMQAQDEQAMREKAIVINREMAERYRMESLVGESAAMKRLFKMMGSVIKADCNVLITGESGTGKELVARAVHYGGPRRLRNFVPLDCGAVPESLVESELFGHRRGAFTGADADKRGLFEEADGGTLFLDEIANTTPTFQAKLLRALQSGEFRRLGETATRRADVRIIAATNGNIEGAIREGRFREDLYYRLNVVTLSLPPLRERESDVLLLAENVARRVCAERGIRFRGIGRGAAGRLLAHGWPGNVRELEHAVEAALVVSEDGLVRREALPEKIRGGEVDAVRDLLRHEVAVVGGDRRPKDERSLIQDALGRCGGDKSRAARLLGWNRMRLYRRMRALGIPNDAGRS